MLQKRLQELTLKQNQMSQLPTIGAGATRELPFRPLHRPPLPTTFVTQTLFNAGLNMNLDADLFGWFTKQNTIKASKYHGYTRPISSWKGPE